MTIKYNHAMTVSYVVISDNPDIPTYSEALEALRLRLKELIANPKEAEEALLGDWPFDTFAFDSETGEEA
tara:strand:- start:508 stop:717 length:210 start_codon:yes stop_codon:yes gene_type:complete